MYSQTKTAFFMSFFILQFVTFALLCTSITLFFDHLNKRDYAKSQYDHNNFMKICQNPQNVLEDKPKRLRKNMIKQQ